DALGTEEVRLAKRFYGWPEDAQFLVPDGVYDRFRDGIGQRGRALRAAWEAHFGAYGREYPEAADGIARLSSGDLSQNWDTYLPTFAADPKGIATREASGKILNAIGARVPWLIGGAGDLAPSTKTKLAFDGAGTLAAGEPGGRNLHFG